MKKPSLEWRVRQAVLLLDLTPLDRLVLIAILQKVSWETFTGNIAAAYIANALNQNLRSTKRSIAKLKRFGFITRKSFKEDKKNTRSLTSINVNLILESVQNDTTKNDTTKNDTTKIDTTPLPKMTLLNTKNDTTNLPKMTPNTLINNNNNIYNNINKSAESVQNDTTKNDTTKNDTTEPDPIQSDDRLKDWQMKAIDLQAKRTGDDSFANHKRIARRLYKVELKKGGYFEKI